MLSEVSIILKPPLTLLSACNGDVRYGGAILWTGLAPR